jgi:hypothetical protein
MKTEIENGATLAMHDLLSSCSVADMERWWCHFNAFHWPADFPASKPEGWDDIQDSEKMTHPMASEAWRILGNLTLLDGCLQYWNSEQFRCGQSLLDNAKCAATGSTGSERNENE